ncbi:hypothetical protein HanIR_Chr05g0252131 [Helianthus annuus]|nr:hypothetical protein HanIR_Chr05g0252131 [Helianthus annuus]
MKIKVTPKSLSRNKLKKKKSYKISNKSRKNQIIKYHMKIICNFATKLLSRTNQESYKNLTQIKKQFK